MKLSSFLGKVWVSQKALVIGTGCVLVVGTATAGTVAVHNYRAANAVQEVVVSEEEGKEEADVGQNEIVTNEVAQQEVEENVILDTADEQANEETETVTAAKTKKTGRNQS